MRKDLREVCEFIVGEHRKGYDLAKVVDRVNQYWPKSKMTLYRARGIYETYAPKIPLSLAAETLAADAALAAEIRKEAAKPVTCHYRFLVNGKLRVCGGEGYPYCREHQLLTQPLPAARYSFSTSQR